MERGELIKNLQAEAQKLRISQERVANYEVSDTIAGRDAKLIEAVLLGLSLAVDPSKGEIKLPSGTIIRLTDEGKISIPSGVDNLTDEQKAVYCAQLILERAK